jgi:hypothetical protein
MIHTQVISEWAYEHYLFYLFLCIADCDCFISEEEVEEIKEEAFKHWPAESISALYKSVHTNSSPIPRKKKPNSSATMPLIFYALLLFAKKLFNT